MNYTSVDPKCEIFVTLGFSAWLLCLSVSLSLSLSVSASLSVSVSLSLCLSLSAPLSLSLPLCRYSLVVSTNTHNLSAHIHKTA